MYSRYPNYRFSGGVKVPENYSGNAFGGSGIVDGRVSAAELSETGAISEAETEAEGERSDVADVTSHETNNNESTEVFKSTSKGLRLPRFKFDIGRIFSGGFGFEEILIIGLILLISQNGSGDDDIILLLALLLFIG